MTYAKYNFEVLFTYFLKSVIIEKILFPFMRSFKKMQRIV